MVNTPAWVQRDLRRQELEFRLRAAADAIPKHTYKQSPSGEYCLSCGLPQINPIHDLSEIDDYTDLATKPSPELVDPAQTSAEHTGMMIALFPDPAQAKKLAVKGGEKPNDLHVTLAYFPQNDDVEKLRELLEVVSETMPPLEGEVSGMGVFSSAHSAGRVTYASVDLPGLPTFRQRLVELCAAHGFAVADNHGYSPHMTLTYGDERHVDPPNEQLSFDEIVLASGKQRYAFKLGGATETAANGDDKVVEHGKHAYSHPHFVNGSGAPDNITPRCLTCGRDPKDAIHEQPAPVKAELQGPEVMRVIAGIDASVDQALVLLRSCRDDQMPEYALQARDLLMTVDVTLDELMEFFGIDDPDDKPDEPEQAKKKPKKGKHVFVHPRLLRTAGWYGASNCVACGKPASDPDHDGDVDVPGAPDNDAPAQSARTTDVTDADTLTQVLTLPKPTNSKIIVTEMAKQYSQDERKAMANQGHAMPDGSFPIKDGEDLENAIKLSGHGGDAVKKHIIKRAHDLKLESKLPATWTSTEKAFVTEIHGRTLLTAPASTLVDMWEKAATPNKHLLWMQGRLVGAEKANRNNAFWKTSDLEMGNPTVAHGPLNWLHEAKHVVGCIADSRLAMPGGYEKAAYNAQPYIGALSAIWRWVYPDEAWVIENASDQGRLWYSMECVSELVECVGDSGCGEKASYRDYMGGRGCQHMRQRSAVRRFENPTFLGAAVIVPPVRPGWADANATVMREAAALAEKAYDDAGRPDVDAATWEQMVAQVVTYAQD